MFVCLSKPPVFVYFPTDYVWFPTIVLILYILKQNLFFFCFIFFFLFTYEVVLPLTAIINYLYFEKQLIFYCKIWPPELVFHLPVNYDFDFHTLIVILAILTYYLVDHDFGPSRLIRLIEQVSHLNMIFILIVALTWSNSNWGQIRVLHTAKIGQVERFIEQLNKTPGSSVTCTPYVLPVRTFLISPCYLTQDWIKIMRGQCSCTSMRSSVICFSGDELKKVAKHRKK